MPHSAPNPEVEQRRLETLEATGLFGSPPEPSFDAITRLAALICDVPVAFVSLVGRDGLWFKSHHGTDTTEMPRPGSLCASAVEQNRPLVVPDVMRDPRFSSNPHYVRDGIRFYAGAPVRVKPGIPLGTVCVVDFRPRTLDATRLSALQALADQAAVLVELHLARKRGMDSVRREGDEHLRLLMDGLPDAVVLVSEGHVIYHNPAALRITGYSAKEIQNANPLDFLIPEDRERAARRIREVMAGGPIYPSEYTARRADGVWCPVEVRSRPLVYQGKPALAVVIQDITERRRAEEERRKLEEGIQQAQKLESLGILAGGIAHDFNNLLTSILGNTSLARRKLPADSPLQERLASIEASSRRAAAVCRQLLVYAGQEETTLQTLNLSELVEQMRPLAAASVGRRVHLAYDLDPNLPHIQGNPSQIGQVIMNLVTNAAEALGGKDGAVEIRTGTGSLPGATGGDGSTRAVFLEVRDRGAGMDDETRHRIFDPFFTTKSMGRGLGMAAVLGIVRAHGGEVRVESAPGAGTVVTVLLPAGSAAAREPASQAGDDVEAA